MKKLLLSILAIVAAGCGYYSAAAETTISFGADNTDLGGSSTVADITSTTLKSGDISISFAKGNSSTAPAYNKAGEIRLYGGKSTSDLDGNKMTISSTNNITTIYLAAGSTCTWGTLTADSGDISVDTKQNATWTGNAKSVIFTVSRNSDKTGTSTQWRLKSAKITEGESGDETKCATPTFNPAAGAVDKGTVVTISCATEGATLLYTLNDSIAESDTNTVTVTINETTSISVVASKTGLDDSDEANATYTVNEQGGDTPAAEGTAVFKVSTVTDPATGAVFAHNTDGNLIGQSFTDNGVTLAFSANSPSNNVGIFNSEKEVRWYANNFITITPAQETAITEIYVRTVSNSKGNFSASAGTVSGTGVGATNPITWTGEANAPILLTPNAQVRFSYITVKFKGNTTGVEDVTVADENAPVEYYNLQGVRVNNPEGGVYIRRQGNTVAKVLVK